MSDAVAGEPAGAAGPARPRMLLITARYSHHGSHSGLAPLRPRLEQRFRVEVARPASADKMLLARGQIGKLIPRLLGQSSPQAARWSPYFTPGSSLIEGAAIRRSRQEPFDVVFVESIEKFHNDLGRIKRDRPGCRLVGMAHQPPSWYRLNNARRGLLDDFDAVIAVSSQSRDHLANELGARNVAMVPHGVDDGFFVPPAAPREIRDGVDICVVGDWLRDFELVSKTIVRTASETPALRWHLVLPTASRTTDAHYRAARHDNVTWYSNIPDEALLGLYHRCQIMFLPLVDATANNAMVEALSSALPVIVSDVGGVRDYAGDCANFLASDDPDEALGILRDCIAHYPDALRRAAAGRERTCAHLSWSVVGPRMAEIALPG